MSAPGLDNIAKLLDIRYDRLRSLGVHERGIELRFDASRSMARFELLFLGDPALGISEFRESRRGCNYALPWPSEQQRCSLALI